MTDILATLVENDFNLDSIKDIKEELYLNLKMKDYDLCIDYNVAECISSYQRTIYTVYCLAKYGSKDLRKLNLDERQRLCLNFKIKAGSTDYKAEIRKVIQMFIDTLPEKHRIWGVLIVCITLLGSWGTYLYYNYKQEELKQRTLLDKEETTKATLQKLLTITEKNPIAREALEYAQNQEKETTQGLERTASVVEINGEVYTPEEIKKIVQEYRKRKKVEKEEISYNVKGLFTVRSMSMVEPYFLKIVSESGEIINKAYFNPRFLDDNIINEIKARLNSESPVTFNMELNVLENKSGEKTVTIIDLSK